LQAAGCKRAWRNRRAIQGWFYNFQESETLPVVLRLRFISTSTVDLMQTSSLDIKSAIANPSKYFTFPREVVAHPSLSRTAKIDILRQWETDARLMAVAEEENLGGGEASQLGAVVNALISLEDPEKMPDGEAHPPSPAKSGA
jgi:hypothetical protein